jgi:tRNA (uracil-5-)-methyltransferase TRM9
MTDAVATRLIGLNREFYDRFASAFSASRARLSPGIERALQWLGNAQSFLDVGCVDGRVGRALLSSSGRDPSFRYVGVDFSRALMGEFGRAEPQSAAAIDAPWPGRESGCRFVTADLSHPEWRLEPVIQGSPFQAALCLAVLFHIPTAERRLRLLTEIRQCLVDDGHLVLSVWQFLHLERMRKRIVPWEETGLRAAEVDPGDLLIDWRSGGRGLRYVHHFDPEELSVLCRDAGFSVMESFRSDGQSGDMSLFLELRVSP